MSEEFNKSIKVSKTLSDISLKALDLEPGSSAEPGQLEETEMDTNNYEQEETVPFDNSLYTDEVRDKINGEIKGYHSIKDKVQAKFADKYIVIEELARKLHLDKLSIGINDVLSKVNPKNLKNLKDYKEWINKFEKIEKLLFYIDKHHEEFKSKMMIQNFVSYLLRFSPDEIDAFIPVFMVDTALHNIDLEKIKVAKEIDKIRDKIQKGNYPLLLKEKTGERKVGIDSLSQLEKTKEQQKSQNTVENNSNDKISIPSLKEFQNLENSRNPILDQLLAKGQKTEQEEDKPEDQEKDKQEEQQEKNQGKDKQEQEKNELAPDLVLDLENFKRAKQGNIKKKKDDSKEIVSPVNKSIEIKKKEKTVKKQVENIEKKEQQEKQEDLNESRQKLIDRYEMALNRFDLEFLDIEEKIVVLENRMNEIKAIDSHHFDFEDDKELANYGDLCRELTYIIQDLNDLDAKKAKMDVLSRKYKTRFKIIKNNLRLSVPVSVEESNWLSELDIKVKNQAVLSVVVENHAYDLTFDTISNNFGRLHHDQKSAASLNNYIAQQWNWVDNPKDIAVADKEKISNIFAMDWLKKHVDPVTLMNNTDLRKKITNSNNKLLLDIYKKYGMILPTEKAGIPLYFKNEQAAIPNSYLDNIYNKFEIHFKKIGKMNAHALIGAILYEKVLTDPQLSLRQATVIKYRLNRLLKQSPKLQKWIKLTDQGKNYKFLHIKKGWFHRIPVDEIKEILKREGGGMLKTAFEIKEVVLPKKKENDINLVSDDMVIGEELIGNSQFSSVEEDTSGLENQMTQIEEDYSKIAKELEADEQRRLEVDKKRNEFIDNYLVYNLGLDAWRKKEKLKSPLATKADKLRYEKEWAPRRFEAYKKFLQNDVRELLMTMGNSSKFRKDAHSYMRMINFLKDYTKKIKSEKHKDHKKYKKYKYLVDTLLKPVE